jgi:uncharacterized membrane protein YbhN (UPF0104 family)
MIGVESLAPPAPVRRSDRRLRGRLLAAGVLAVLAGLACYLLGDLGIVRFGRVLVTVPWFTVPLLVLITAGHYCCSALALQAASGHRLRDSETFMAQIAAAAASRVLPGGLGGLAVNTRYLTRCGVAMPQAMTAVGLAKLAGGLTHAGLFALVAVLNHQAGTDLLHRAGPFPPNAIIIAGSLGVVALLGVVWWIFRCRCRAVVNACAGVWKALVVLARDPRALMTLLLSSAGTPVLMGGAFAVSLIAVPGGPSVFNAGGLFLAYLTGSAVGSSVPLPSGAGAAEAVLAASALAVGVAPIPALQGVLLFRLVTFWLPVPLGVVLGRRLRRIGRL